MGPGAAHLLSWSLSGVVFCACSKLDSANSKRSMWVLSSADRRSESLFLLIAKHWISPIIVKRRVARATYQPCAFLNLLQFSYPFLFWRTYWNRTVVFQHFSKSDKRGWLSRWPLWSFTNPVWHSDTLCLHQLCPTQMAHWAKTLCRYFGQGRTLKDIFMRAAHWMACFVLSKLNLA